MQTLITKWNVDALIQKQKQIVIKNYNALPSNKAEHPEELSVTIDNMKNNMNKLAESLQTLKDYVNSPCNQDIQAIFSKGVIGDREVTKTNIADFVEYYLSMTTMNLEEYSKMAKNEADEDSENGPMPR